MNSIRLRKNLWIFKMFPLLASIEEWEPSKAIEILERTLLVSSVICCVLCSESRGTKKRVHSVSFLSLFFFYSFF